MSIVTRTMVMLQKDANANRRAAVGQGGNKLKALTRRREANRTNIEEGGDRAAQLGEDLTEQQNKNWFLKAADWTFAQDPVGDINERQTENQAGIEKSQAELEQMRNEQKAVFRDIERAEQNFSGVDRETSQMMKKRERTVRDSEL